LMHRKPEWFGIRVEEKGIPAGAGE